MAQIAVTERLVFLIKSSLIRSINSPMNGWLRYIILGFLSHGSHISHESRVIIDISYI